MTTTTKQLSRVAGVPRLKLPIWKAAASQFFTGQEPSRDDQRNKGRKTKVALLRELAASDPAVRSWVIKFATDLRARDARAVAAEQGFQMPEKLGFVPLFPGDRPELTVLNRRVCCMEQPNADELLAKLETLYPDGDSPEVEARQAQDLADLQTFINEPKPVRHGCNQCGQPATRQIGDHHFCPVHDGTPTRPQLEAPAFPMSPAQYANSGFGKAPRPAVVDIAAQRQADLARQQRPDFGPMPDTYVTSAGGFEKKKRD